ncbi:MAG: hypothetical protein U5L11_15510 [Arhodomonas sp.]|nr:hypothetical protein [Arhodomonas sp.]
MIPAGANLEDPGNGYLDAILLAPENKDALDGGNRGRRDEDFSNSGQLDPSNVASVPQNVTTNNNGEAFDPRLTPAAVRPVGKGAPGGHRTRYTGTEARAIQHVLDEDTGG